MMSKNNDAMEAIHAEIVEKFTQALALDPEYTVYGVANGLLFSLARAAEGGLRADEGGEDVEAAALDFAAECFHDHGLCGGCFAGMARSAWHRANGTDIANTEFETDLDALMPANEVPA